MEPKVFVIVINWNSPADTVECLRSLSALVYKNYQVLIIDNGSTDQSVPILKAALPSFARAELLETGENLGFSGGVNYGIKVAFQRGGDYIWLLNSDTEVEPSCLTNLIIASEKNPKVGIAGSKIFLHSNKNILWHAGATLAKYTLQPLHYGFGKRDTEQYLSNRLVDYVTGCSFLIRAGAIESIGVMDDRFFLYYEEADLCHRARQQGWQILYVADSQLWHKVAGSSSGLHVRTYYDTRNRMLYAAKNAPQILPIVLSYLIVHNVLRPLIKNRSTEAKFALLGITDFLRSRFGKLGYNA